MYLISCCGIFTGINIQVISFFSPHPRPTHSFSFFFLSAQVHLFSSCSSPFLHDFNKISNRHTWGLVGDFFLLKDSQYPRTSGFEGSLGDQPRQTLQCGGAEGQRSHWDAQVGAGPGSGPRPSPWLSIFDILSFLGLGGWAVWPGQGWGGRLDGPSAPSAGRGMVGNALRETVVSPVPELGKMLNESKNSPTPLTAQMRFFLRVETMPLRSQTSQ